MSKMESEFERYRKDDARMKAIARLIYVIGFVPVLIYAMLRWVATGESALALMDSFEQWRDE